LVRRGRILLLLTDAILIKKAFLGGRAEREDGRIKLALSDF
jgi:hypothetical protein